MEIDKLIKDSNLTQLEENVLRYIVSNIDNVMKIGVRGVAKANYTSTSTIMRLSKKLGYTGFIDMHYHLMPLVKKDTHYDEASSDFLSKEQLDSLLKYTSEKQINDFLDYLNEKSYKFNFIYATGFSVIAAEYINKKLLLLGKRCILASGTDSASIFENNLDSIGTMLVISKSGETRQVLSKVKTAKENKINIVSFTGETDNTLSRLADVSFKIQDNNKSDDRNVMPSVFFPNLLLLFEFLIYKDYRRLKDK